MSEESDAILADMERDFASDVPGMNPDTDVPFTQYVMPDGVKCSVWIKRPEDTIKKCKALLEIGCFFETEMLSDYKSISMTCERGDEIVSHEIVPNGPEVPLAVDRIVGAAYSQLIGDSPEQPAKQTANFLTVLHERAIEARKGIHGEIYYDGYGETTATDDGNFVKLEQIDPDSIIELIKANPKLWTALKPMIDEAAKEMIEQASEDRAEERIERMHRYE